MERKIDRLIQHSKTDQSQESDVSPTQMEGSDAPGHDGMDQKRLKERLKKSISQEQNKHSDTAPTRTDWVEYVFGICSANQRLGKEGSRSRIPS
jgi:hypothetical protein